MPTKEPGYPLDINVYLLDKTYGQTSNFWRTLPAEQVKQAKAIIKMVNEN